MPVLQGCGCVRDIYADVGVFIRECDFHARMREERDAARAEAAALRQDAERYRWLCDASGADWDALLGPQMIGQLDAAIDAAMREGK